MNPGPPFSVCEQVNQRIFHLVNVILVLRSPFLSFIIFTNPSARAGYDTRSIFKRSLTGLNSEFSFSSTSCLTKAEEPRLSYYLPIAGGRIIGFIHFPRVSVLCEMQSVSSRIWTSVAVSISYDDNHYTTSTFFFIIYYSSDLWWLVFISTLNCMKSEVINISFDETLTHVPRIECLS